jgi:hypothetical protein
MLNTTGLHSNESAKINFAALAADIRDADILRAEAWQQNLRNWSSDVRTADARAISRAHVDALVVATSIGSLPTLSDADAVVILAAVFRCLSKDNTHIDARRLALTSLCDVCVDLAGSAA